MHYGSVSTKTKEFGDAGWEQLFDPNFQQLYNFSSTNKNFNIPHSGFYSEFQNQ
jgi:hypothetical protein